MLPSGSNTGELPACAATAPGRGGVNGPPAPSPAWTGRRGAGQLATSTTRTRLISQRDRGCIGSLLGALAAQRGGLGVGEDPIPNRRSHIWPIADATAHPPCRRA